MPPENFYKQNLVDLQATLKNLLKKRNLFGWLRFAMVILIACTYFIFPLGLIVVTFTILLLLVVLTRLIYADLNNKIIIESTKNIINFNED